MFGVFPFGVPYFADAILGGGVTPPSSGIGCIHVDQPMLTSPTFREATLTPTTMDPSATGTSTAIDPELC